MWVYAQGGEKFFVFCYANKYNCCNGWPDQEHNNNETYLLFVIQEPWILDSGGKWNKRLKDLKSWKASQRPDVIEIGLNNTDRVWTREGRCWVGIRSRLDFWYLRHIVTPSSYFRNFQVTMKLTAGIIADWPRHLRINIWSALWHWQVKFWRFHISCYEGKTNIIPFGSCNEELESGMPHSTCTCLLIAPLKWSTQEAIFKGIGYLIPPKTNLEVSGLVSSDKYDSSSRTCGGLQPSLSYATPWHSEFKFDNFRNLQQKLAAGTMAVLRSNGQPRRVGLACHPNFKP